MISGVSCDSCLRSNFRGLRYKCLICYDYDLCSSCYEGGATSTRHSTEHPMQCILTRTDHDLYYGGEAFSPDHPQSFTCPYCKRMGFSDLTLLEHVTAEHTVTPMTAEVVCPVCAASPGGEPNLVTDDFAGHLTLEHRSGPRDLISFLDEPAAIRHGGVRRIPHSGRTLGGPRSRRANMHFTSAGSGLSTLSPQGRESVDLIAELQQQLSGGVRRGTPQHSQLQQLQMQIQMERQGSTNRQLERSTNIPRRQPMITSNSGGPGSGNNNSSTASTLLGLNANPSNTSIQTILSVMSFNSNNASRDTNFLSSSANNGNSGGTGSGSSGGGACSYISSNPSNIQLASSSGSGTVVNAGAGINASSMQMPNIHHPSSQYLMARLMMPTLDDVELAQLEQHRADR